MLKFLAIVPPICLFWVTFPGVASAAGGSGKECLKASEAAHDFAKDHRLLDERAQLVTCAAPTCPVEIRKDCLRRVDEVNASLPSIIFEARDANGADIRTVKVTMDGAPFLDQLDGSAVTIDPGEHRFTFEQAGQTPVEKQFVIREAQKDRREVVTLGLPPAPPPSPTVAAATQPTVATPAVSPTDQSSESSSLLSNKQRVAAVVVGGVGVIGIGVGSVFGLLSSSKHDDADKHCDGGTCHDASGPTLRSEARTLGNVSTVAFIVGAAGLAGGAALWFTAPHGRETQVGLAPGGFLVKGTW